MLFPALSSMEEKCVRRLSLYLILCSGGCSLVPVSWAGTRNKTHPFALGRKEVGACIQPEVLRDSLSNSYGNLLDMRPWESYLTSLSLC